MLCSEPANQYCITKKKMRTSCAVPGMKRSNLGKRRSMAICLAPADAGLSLPFSSLAEGRSFFSKPIRPPLCVLATYLPMRPSCMTWGADMMQTMASTSKRRCSNTSMMGRKWSSMNNMVTMTILAWARSSRQCCKRSWLLRQSLAACTFKRKPRSLSCSATFSKAPDKWLSMVTSTTVLAAANRSAAEVGFGIVERLHGDG